MVAAAMPITATPITARLIPVVWITDPAEADRLLGEEYRYLLDEVLDNFRQAAPEHGWPLAQIDIDYHQDMEIESWEYLILTLRYDCPRPEAKEHWVAGMRTVVKSMQDELAPPAWDVFVERLDYVYAGCP